MDFTVCIYNYLISEIALIMFVGVVTLLYYVTQLLQTRSGSFKESEEEKYKSGFDPGYNFHNAFSLFILFLNT